jgi:hypothetical protein
VSDSERANEVRSALARSKQTICEAWSNVVTNSWAEQRQKETKSNQSQKPKPNPPFQCKKYAAVAVNPTKGYYFYQKGQPIPKTKGQQMRYIFDVNGHIYWSNSYHCAISNAIPGPLFINKPDQNRCIFLS